MIAGGSQNQANTILIGNLAISKMLAENCDQMVKYQQELTAANAKDAASTYKRALYILH